MNGLIFSHLSHVLCFIYRLLEGEEESKQKLQEQVENLKCSLGEERRKRFHDVRLTDSKISTSSAPLQSSATSKTSLRLAPDGEDARNDSAHISEDHSIVGDLKEQLHAARAMCHAQSKHYCVKIQHMENEHAKEIEKLKAQIKANELVFLKSLAKLKLKLQEADFRYTRLKEKYKNDVEYFNSKIDTVIHDRYQGGKEVKSEAFLHKNVEKIYNEKVSRESWHHPKTDKNHHHQGNQSMKGRCERSLISSDDLARKAYGKHKKKHKPLNKDIPQNSVNSPTSRNKSEVISSRGSSNGITRGKIEKSEIPKRQSPLSDKVTSKSSKGKVVNLPPIKWPPSLAVIELWPYIHVNWSLAVWTHVNLEMEYFKVLAYASPAQTHEYFTQFVEPPYHEACLEFGKNDQTIPHAPRQDLMLKGRF